MGIQLFTPKELDKYLKKINSSESQILTENRSLPADENFGKGAVSFHIQNAPNPNYWKISLPACEFKVYFKFSNGLKTPKPLRMKSDWQIGFIANVVHSLERIKYAGYKDELIYNPGTPVIDSDSKSTPLYAKGQGEFGIASYVFEYSDQNASIKEPESVARQIAAMSPESRDKILQLWYEDSPSSYVQDWIAGGRGLEQYQRILVIKTWIVAMPVGGQVPDDGWFGVSTPYCIAGKLTIDKRNRPFFNDTHYESRTYAFSVNDNFKPDKIDDQKFAQYQAKNPAISFSGIDKKKMKNWKAITGGVAENDRANQWAADNNLIFNLD